MTEAQYQVLGMTCGGCVKRVNALLAEYADEAVVTLDPPLATLTNPSADMDTLNQALSTIGHYQLLTTAKTEEKAPTNNDLSNNQNWLSTYQPLLTVIAYLLLITLLVEANNNTFLLSRWMQHFMAGFFLIFSFFKLLDIRGFASSYAMYDIVAKQWYGFGLAYPFIELLLGIWYLIGKQLLIANLITLLVMGTSSIGVIMAVANRQEIRCACLGTGFNLPMSTVTIIEDLTMVGMAAWMVFFSSSL